MADTTIEWTRGDDGRPGSVWNPTRGCSRVSEGCRHCYGERQAARFCGPGQPYDGLATAVAPRDDLDRVGGRRAGWTGVVRLVPERLGDPLRWRRPRRVFVNSMSDLFHEKFSDEDIAAVFGVMAACPQHTFQCLTKRPGRMRAWFAWVGDDAQRAFAAMREHLAGGGIYGLRRELLGDGVRWPLPNVHLGVSVEDQAAADARIPHLLACPAAVRWISYEPAIGPMDFSLWLGGRDGIDYDSRGEHCIRCGIPWDEDPHVCPPGFGPRLDWIVVGGESGPHARPFDLAWGRDVIRQCREADVACFVKQLGTRIVGEAPTLRGHPDFYTVARWYLSGGGGWMPPIIGPLVGRRPDNAVAWGLHHPKGGDPAEWSEDLRVREFPHGR